MYFYPLFQNPTDSGCSHRLSTITSADQILVLHAGKVVEAGNHQELLERKGRYHNMWRKQIRAERAAEQAFQMAAKAKALKDAVMARPGSSGIASEDVSENEAENRSGLATPELLSQALKLSGGAPRDTISTDGSNLDENSGDDETKHQPSGSKVDEKTPKGKSFDFTSAPAGKDDGNFGSKD